MAITSQTHTGNGTRTLYAITFPYLSTSDVKATLDGTATTAFSVTASNQVQFNTAPGNGVAIRISRVTDDSDTKVVFNTGSSIKAADLNDAFKRSLYLYQEASDNTFPSGITVTGAVSNFDRSLNFNGDSNTKLKFRDSAENNRALLYSDGTDLRLELKSQINDFKIFDDTALRFTFDDDGNFSCHHDSADTSVTATTFNGNLNGSLQGNTNCTGTLTASSFSGNLTGDVSGSATTLATARTIAGQSFDGSADISIAATDLSDVNQSLSTTSQVQFASVTASLTGTADKSDAVKRNSFSLADTWKDVAAWNSTNGSYNELTNSDGNNTYIQIDGQGNLRASGNITATGNLSGTLTASAVGASNAALSVGAVGTYAMCTLINNTADLAAGSTVSGSNLRYSNASAVANGTPSGSWRLMGRIANAASDSSDRETSLWLRIS